MSHAQRTLRTVDLSRGHLVQIYGTELWAFVWTIERLGDNRLLVTFSDPDFTPVNAHSLTLWAVA